MATPVTVSSLSGIIYLQIPRFSLSALFIDDVKLRSWWIANGQWRLGEEAPPGYAHRALCNGVSDGCTSPCVTIAMASQTKWSESPLRSCADLPFVCFVSCSVVSSADLRAQLINNSSWKASQVISINTSLSFLFWSLNSLLINELMTAVGCCLVCCEADFRKESRTP